MRWKHISIFTALFLSSLAHAESGRERFEAAKALLENAPPSIQSLRQQAPKTYEFASRFDQKSSVSYVGQTFRQVLLLDLKQAIDGLSKGAYPGLSEEAYKALNSYYSYRFDGDVTAPLAINGYSTFQVKPVGLNGQPLPVAEGSIYEDLQEEGKQLRDKTAGNDNPLRRGSLKGWKRDNFYGISLSGVNADGKNEAFVEPEDLVEALLQVVAREASEGTAFVVPNGDLSEQRITAAAVMPDGVDLAELLAKFLNGAVSFSQGAEDYLAIEGKAGKGLSADNAAIAKAGMNYTLLEHNWDEGLGYFGAARDYTRYQLAEINAGRSLDSNGDGSISLLSEKNYGMSINAARRDLGAPSGSTNYAMGAMQSFLRGRALITSANEQAKPYIAAEATLALGYWERTIAASAVSYVNKVNKILQSYGTEAYSYRNLAKAWAELKGFSLSFQFHPESSLSDGEFDRLHDLLGDSPVLPHRDGPEAVAAYQAKLQEVRAIYQQSFGFDARDVAAW